MKVTIGNSVKDIPAKYAAAVGLVPEDRLEKPDKIRLTQFERFLFAEAAWRDRLKYSNVVVYKYLSLMIPKCAGLQWNRNNYPRFVVRYEALPEHAIEAIAITSAHVWRQCPVDLKFEENVNFVDP